MAEPPSSSEDYHRAELRIALDPGHPSHILPPAQSAGKLILDVGCGAGQTLIAAYPGRICYGVDIDETALRLGKSLTPNIRFVRARAEYLPWRDAHFDLVAARVSLAYTDISASLAEIRRVLREGGELWLTLHSFHVVWEQARRGNLKGWIFFLYILVNSLWFHCTGRQFAFLGRFESFQTEGGIARALRRQGFTDVRIERTGHFVVSAVRGRR